MSTQQQKKNSKGQTTPNSKKTKTSKQANKKSGKKNNTIFKETFKVIKKELWTSINTFGDITVVRPFNSEYYPKWFANLAKLFESYKIKYIRIHVKSNNPRTSAGSYAFYLDVTPTDKPRNFDDICTQGGHYAGWIAQNGMKHYGGGMFRQQPRYYTHGSDKFPFTFYMDVQSKESIQLLIYIEYSVTFYIPQLNVGIDAVVNYTDENGNIGTEAIGNSTRQSISVKTGDYFTITTDALESATVTVNGITEKLFRILGEVGSRYGLISPVAAALLGTPERLIFELIDNAQSNILSTLSNMVSNSTHVQATNDQTTRSAWTLSGRAALPFVLNSGSRYLTNSFSVSNGIKM